MQRLIAFILLVLGGINWLMIGTLQYDFVAGMFGTQANIFSRIIYFIIGIATVYILIVSVFNKGRIKLWGYKKKKPKKQMVDEDF